MKHINKFEKFGMNMFGFKEKLHIPKFKIHDPVVIKKEPDTLYAVDGYDYDPTERTIMIKNICRLRKYEDIGKYANKEGFYSWIKEDELRSPTSEELKNYVIKMDSEKYNL
jgi:hypothetical protein